MAGIFDIFKRNDSGPKRTEAFFLDSDEAKTYGDIEFMRKTKTVRRTFAKTVSGGGGELIQEVSSMKMKKRSTDETFNQSSGNANTSFSQNFGNTMTSTTSFSQNTDTDTTSTTPSSENAEATTTTSTTPSSENTEATTTTSTTPSSENTEATTTSTTSDLSMSSTPRRSSSADTSMDMFRNMAKNIRRR